MNPSTSKGGKGYKRVYEEVASSSDSDMDEQESQQSMEVEENGESDDGK